jgi:hypothetical protein
MACSWSFRASWTQSSARWRSRSLWPNGTRACRRIAGCCSAWARLEAIAEPGAICISRQAYDQVEGKLALQFRELGPQNLKNIAKPVEVFAIPRVGAGSGAGQLPKCDVRTQYLLFQWISLC